MKVGVLGTGMVGKTLGTKLASLGHAVLMGSRTKGNAEAVAWAAGAGGGAREGTFRDAAEHGELVLNCTGGAVSLEALRTIDARLLDGKVLVDVANPLDFSGGAARLTVCNDDSLGEQVQRAFPRARVVKALNTVNCEVMVDPGRLAGEHDLFICGDDARAKAQVTELVKSFGWRSVVDLGDITGARATEQFLPLWLRLMGALETPHFNVRLVRATA
jgi:predicted dinucleotide-binding enzyme